MNTVSFPGFGLSFELKATAFTVLGWPVRWYGIIIACGFMLAVLFCASQAKKFGITQDDLLDMLLFAVPGAIVGARLYYVLFNPGNFQSADGGLDVIQILRIQDGGLAIYGGIIAAVLVAFLVMRHKKIPFLAMADLGAYGLLIGQCVGRWGNFVNVEAYGGETSLPWRMEITEYVGGSLTTIQVHPTFLYESLWNLLGFILLFILLKKGLRKFDGMMFFSYIAWYGLGRGIIEGLRTDSLYFFSTGLRVSQLLGFLSALVAIGYLIYRFRQHPSPEEMLVNQVEEKEEMSDVSKDS